MNPQILTLFVFVSVLWDVTPAQTLLKKRLNFGVFFKRQNQFQVSTDRWFHSFRIQVVPPIWSGRNNSIWNTKPTVTCTRRLTSDEMTACRAKTVHVTTYHNMQTRAYERINDLVMQIDEILKGKETEWKDSRKRRWSLFPVIGGILHYGFGMSRDSDRERLEEHVKQIALETSAMAETVRVNEGQLLSAITVVNQRVTAANQRMDIQQRAIRQLADGIEKNALSEVQLIEASTEMAYNLSIIHEDLRFILQGLQHITSGNLDQSILSKSQLTEGLGVITEAIERNKPKAICLMTDPDNYYQFAKFTVTRKAYTLLVTFAIPISTLWDKFTLYAVHNFPKQISDRNQHGTVVEDLPKYMAISDSGEYHAIFDIKPVLHPGDQLDIVYADEIQLKSIHADQCILGIYFNNVTMVHENCEVVFDLKKPNSVKQLVENQFSIEGFQNYTIRCDDDVEIGSCSSCLITIKDGCELITRENIFPIRKIWKTGRVRNTTTVYLINLASVQNFFEGKDIERILLDTVYRDEFLIDIPSFDAASNKSIEIDKRLKQKFDLVAKAVKNGQQILGVQNEKLQGITRELSDDVNDDETWSWWSCGQAAAGLVTIALCIIVAYLLIKVNKLTALIFLGKGQATEMPLIYSTSTRPQMTTYGPSEITLEFTKFEIIIVTVLLILLVAYGVSKIWKCLKKKSRMDENFLGIKISDRKRMELVYWYGISQFLQQGYQLSASRPIKDVRVTRKRCTNYLEFDWPIILTSDGKNKWLPNKIALPFKQARKLKRMVRVSHIYDMKVCVTTDRKSTEIIPTTEIISQLGMIPSDLRLQSSIMSPVLHLHPGKSSEVGNEEADLKSAQGISRKTDEGGGDGNMTMSHLERMSKIFNIYPEELLKEMQESTAATGPDSIPDSGSVIQMPGAITEENRGMMTQRETEATAPILFHGVTLPPSAWKWTIGRGRAIGNPPQYA